MAGELQRVVGQFKFDENAKGVAASQFRVPGGQGRDSHLASHLNSPAASTSSRVQ
jgi:hypothetical protein